MGDDANYNSYANSRHTITVGAIDETGKHAFYSTPGAPVLVSAYSIGDEETTQGISTTDVTGTDGVSAGNYTHQFGGTSAAAPQVSGVLALMLEANPTLSWRDAQHILVETASKNDPSDTGWEQNGVGRWVNYKYGFGAVDAEAAVARAETWKPVSKEVAIEFPEIHMEENSNQGIGILVPDGDPNGIPTTVETTTVEVQDNINLEWVEVSFDANHPDIDNLHIELVHTDPTGRETASVLMEPHQSPNSLLVKDHNFQWDFTTPRHWGETSQGTWKLRVSDRTDTNQGRWNSWKIRFYGTETGEGFTFPIPPDRTYVEDQPLHFFRDAQGKPIQIQGNPEDTVTVSLEIADNPEDPDLRAKSFYLGSPNSQVSFEYNSEQNQWNLNGEIAQVNQLLADLTFQPKK
ncbi:MAG: S8 family serine peptidase, partial [Coleofasciculaceae cyanobacterium SM2_3_26]|nr:S8 family serine peptidase [Coleofasciculaceae cyanobacterium SM2_3_26]